MSIDPIRLIRSFLVIIYKPVYLPPASQIAAVAGQLCHGLDINVQLLLGGRTKQIMLNPTFAAVDLLVGTMGATSKLVTSGVYRMHQCEHVVLDEADTLLDDSFNPKLTHFLKRFPVSAFVGRYDFIFLLFSDPHD